VVGPRADTPAPADGDSIGASISGDGRFVAFVTIASNIIEGFDHIALLVVADRDPNGTGVFDQAFAYTLIAKFVNDVPSLSADANRLAFTVANDAPPETVVATLRHGTHGEILPPTSTDYAFVTVPATASGSGGTYDTPQHFQPKLSAN